MKSRSSSNLSEQEVSVPTGAEFILAFARTPFELRTGKKDIQNFSDLCP